MYSKPYKAQKTFIEQHQNIEPLIAKDFSVLGFIIMLH